MAGNQMKRLTLYKAVLDGNWEAAQQIFDNDPSEIHANLDDTGITTLHVAVATGKSIDFVENLVALMSNESLSIREREGWTALDHASAVGNVAAASILVNRMPDLLYIPTNDGKFPIQLAAEFGQRDMLKYLISVTKDDHLGQRPYDGIQGFRLLFFTILAEYYDIAIYLVNKYPELALVETEGALVWDAITRKHHVFSRRFSFWERFIYSCASVVIASKTRMSNSYDVEGMLHNTQSVSQNMHARLSQFVEQLGPIKRVRNILSAKRQVLELVKCLSNKVAILRFNGDETIYYKAVLRAAEVGVHEIVQEIVDVFPTAAFCSFVQSRKTIFHLAAENRSLRVFNLIYQMSDHKGFYSDRRDADENNLLHLAAKLAPIHKLNEIPGAALQMQCEIQWYKEVEKHIRPGMRERQNKYLKSPKMIFTEEHKELKEAGEKWMKDTANSCTISAALIATIMFAAAITVPGGNDSNTGFPMFSVNGAFIVFAISDAISLFASITSLLMFLAILTSRYAEEDFLRVLPKRLIIGLGTLFLSITFMMVAFSTTIYLVFGKKHRWVLIPVAALACLPVTSFVLLQFPLFVDVIYSTYGPSIFGKKSNRSFY